VDLVVESSLWRQSVDMSGGSVWVFAHKGKSRQRVRLTCMQSALHGLAGLSFLEASFTRNLRLFRFGLETAIETRRLSALSVTVVI
jgi:hypothetical protein